MTHHTGMGWAPAPRQGLVPLYPYGFGTILGKAFVVLKGNPKVLLLFVVGVQTLSMVISTAVIGAVAFWAFSRAATVPPSSPEFAALMAGSAAIVIIATVLVSLALVGVTVLAQGVVIAEVAHASLAEKARLGTLWRRVKPAFWRLVGYSLLISAAAIVAMVVVAIVIAGFALLDIPSAWVFVALFFFLAIAGGVVLFAWIGTKLYLAPSAIVLEGAGPVRAIGRSWVLTRGRFWSTFGVVVLLSLITQFAAGIISSVLSFFAPLIGTLLVPLGMGSGSPERGMGALAVLSIIIAVIVAVLTFAIASIMTIITGSGGTLAYIDARMRDEGIDLRMRRYVDAGGNAEDPYTYIADAQPSPYARPAAPTYAPGPQAYAQPGYAPQPGPAQYPPTQYPPTQYPAPQQPPQYPPVSQPPAQYPPAPQPPQYPPAPPQPPAPPV